MGCLEMVGTGVDKPSECKGSGSEGRGPGGVEGRRRNVVVGYDGQELKTGI